VLRFGPVLRLWVLFVLLLGACRFVHAEQADTLEIGILPNISSRILLSQYQPMREYLERVLMRPVQVSTAPDWQSFYARARRGEYALTITAAHLARLHQLESGHIPLVLFTPGIKALLVVDKDKPISKIGDLRGTTLALSNPKSLVTLQGMQWLADQGLRRGENLRTLNTPTDDSVGNLVLNGDCVAALISGGEFKAIPDVLRNRLQIFQQIAEVPGFVALASSRLPTADVARIKRALLDFTRNSDESNRFFAATGFQGFIDASEVQMKPLDVYLRETRRIIAE
jgi:phosphonate transport system substrate-binding protein